MCTKSFRPSNLAEAATHHATSCPSGHTIFHRIRAKASVGKKELEPAATTEKKDPGGKPSRIVASRVLASAAEEQLVPAMPEALPGFGTLARQRPQNAFAPPRTCQFVGCEWLTWLDGSFRTAICKKSSCLGLWKGHVFTHHPKKVTAAESPGIGFLVVFSRYLDSWHTLGNRRLTLFGVFLFNPGPKGGAQKILVRLVKYLHFSLVTDFTPSKWPSYVRPYYGIFIGVITTRGPYKGKMCVP